MSLLSRLAAHRLVAGLLVLPMLVGSLVVWSLADRAEETAQVPAAVVNLDEPVLEKGKPPVAAGRLLAAGLTSPRTETDRPFGWTLTDGDDARAGLADGSYYAVITIPPGFSRTLSDTLEGKDPKRATIGVTSTDETSALVGQVSDQVAEVSADKLGERVTTTYLDQVFTRTGDLAGKLGEAADGAERLADGTDRLADGAGELSDGIGRLATGADRLADGGERLAGGTRELADGTRRLASGSDRLADGLGTLERRTDPLPAQTDRLADGARRLSDGVVPYTKLLRGWSDACRNPLIAAQAARLCVFTERAVGPNDRNAKRLAEGSRQLADGTRRLAEGVEPLTEALDRSATGARELADGTQRLADGTGRLTSGAEQLTGGATKLADGARTAADGADRLADGSGRLGDGSTRLADGLDRGAEAVPTYDEQESKELADVIAAPVSARSDDGRTPDGATQLAPAAIAFALWLGAFATYLVRGALPDRLLGRAASASALARAGLLPGMVIGAGQAVLLYVVLGLLGADLGSPPATLGLMVVAAGAFAALNQALVAALGRGRGWIASIVLATLQAVSLGGVIPLDTAPGPLQALNGLLPMTRAADGLAAAALDGPGSALVAVVVLVLWAGAAFLVTTRAAARAQQVDLADLAERDEDPGPEHLARRADGTGRPVTGYEEGR